MEDFAIHALRVGEGELALSPMPGRAGDYPADLARILDWLPALVITMTMGAELDRSGAATFGDDLRAQGTQWRHCPVVDFGVDTGLDWPPLRDEALGILARGGRVLTHCYGGCGRSGMMALRLMIAAGEGADAALTRLRALRPCAVETPAQLDWALAGW